MTEVFVFIERERCSKIVSDIMSKIKDKIPEEWRDFINNDLAPIKTESCIGLPKEDKTKQLKLYDIKTNKEINSDSSGKTIKVFIYDVDACQRKTGKIEPSRTSRGFEIFNSTNDMEEYHISISDLKCLNEKTGKYEIVSLKKFKEMYMKSPDLCIPSKTLKVMHNGSPVQILQVEDLIEFKNVEVLSRKKPTSSSNKTAKKPNGKKENHTYLSSFESDLFGYIDVKTGMVRLNSNNDTVRKFYKDSEQIIKKKDIGLYRKIKDAAPDFMKFADNLHHISRQIPENMSQIADQDIKEKYENNLYNYFFNNQLQTYFETSYMQELLKKIDKCLVS